MENRVEKIVKLTSIDWNIGAEGVAQTFGITVEQIEEGIRETLVMSSQFRNPVDGLALALKEGKVDMSFVCALAGLYLNDRSKKAMSMLERLLRDVADDEEEEEK